MRLIERLSSLWLGIALCALAFAASAQVVTPNPALTLDAAGGARVLVRQDDGKIIAAGAFTKANGSPRSGLARFNADGTLDYGFAPVANGEVTAVVIAGQAIYVAGAFTQIGGVTRAGFARLRLSDGAVAPSFDPAPNGPVTALAADESGNVYAAGTFSAIGGVAGRKLVKLNGDTGAADAAWNPAFPEPLTRIGALAIRAEWLYVVGYVAGDPAGEIGRAHRFALASAARDPAWSPPRALVNNEGQAVVIAFDGAGNVFVAGPGGITAPNGPLYGTDPPRQVPLVTVGKFLGANGSPDPAWTTPANGSTFVAVDGASVYTALDGVLFGGAGGAARTIARRDAATGAVRAGWTSLDPGLGYLYAAVVAPEGVWVAGDISHLGGQAAPGIARLDALSGARQSGINARLTAPGSGQAVARLTDGRYLLGGMFDFVNGFQRSNLARLTADGQFDPTWNAGTDGEVFRIAVHGAHAYVGGYFTQAGGLGRNGAARFDASSGAVDPAWNPDVQGGVRRFAFSGTDVFLGGPFSIVAGTPRLAIAKVSGADGSLLTDFAPPFVPGCNWTLGTAGLAYADGFVYAGTVPNCMPDGRRLARFAATNGALDSGWNPAPNGAVRDILLAGGDMVLLGDFTEFGTPGTAVAKQRLAKLATATGTVDAAWGDPPLAQTFVSALAIVGSYLHTGGHTIDPGSGLNVPVVDRHALATGLRDATWNPVLVPQDTPVDGSPFGVYGMAGSANGDRTFIAGNFAMASGFVREGFAAFSNTGSSGLTAKANYQGLWWGAPGGTEAGWGINFSHQSNTIFATWFTYGADGKPLWLAAVLSRISPTVYAGDIFTTTGPPFDSIPFDPAQVVETVVGAMTVTFLNDESAYMTYVVSGISQAKYLARQNFATPVPTCVWGAQPDLASATNFQDLWWRHPAGSESGWGINLTHQGNIIFATWFTYGADGKPLWLIVLAERTGENIYTGAVSTVTGPPFYAEPFDPALVVETVVGSATFTFADGNRATFDYTVNGTSQSKQLTRQVFNAPGTLCY